MNKKNTIIHYSLLSMSLLYSFLFYNSIAIELAIMAIIFDLVKPNMFITAKESKGMKRNVFSVLVIILVAFNLLAISSSFINKYNKESINKTLNTEYTKQQEKLKQLKSNITSIETELKDYPTLEVFTAKSPKWEDKTELNQTWQQGKQDITNRLNTANTEYNKELSRKVDKYNITDKKNGYNAIFTALSQKINVKTSNLVLLIYILFAIVLEILIFYTKTLSVREQKNYVKSNEEMTVDLVKEMNYQWYKNQLQALKNNFDKNLSGCSEEKEQIFVKVYSQQDEDQMEITEIEQSNQKLIEKSKEDPQQEKLFEKKPLNMDRLETVFRYIIENLKPGNISQGIKKISDNTSIDRGEVERIREELIKHGYLQPDKLQTLVVRKELNLKDFDEA